MSNFCSVSVSKDWVICWVYLDVKRRSHIPHLTENTGCKSQCLPTGLVQKCYFHCSDAPLFLCLCQSSCKLFSSTKLWPTSFHHPFLFPSSSFSCFPYRFTKIISSSLAHRLPLLAIPISTFLSFGQELASASEQHAPKTLRSNLSTQTEQTRELPLKRKTCLPMRLHAYMICSTSYL